MLDAIDGALIIFAEQLDALGIPRLGESRDGITYADEATQEHRQAGDAFFESFDWKAAEETFAARVSDAMADKAAVVAGANQILEDAASGVAACESDLSLIASGLSAAASITTVSHCKTIITGMLQVLQRVVDRQNKHIAATATITKYLRNEAAK